MRLIDLMNSNQTVNGQQETQQGSTMSINSGGDQKIANNSTISFFTPLSSSSLIDSSSISTKKPQILSHNEQMPSSASITTGVSSQSASLHSPLMSRLVQQTSQLNLMNNQPYQFPQSNNGSTNAPGLVSEKENKATTNITNSSAPIQFASPVPNLIPPPVTFLPNSASTAKRQPLQQQTWSPPQLDTNLSQQQQQQQSLLYAQYQQNFLRQQQPLLHPLYSPVFNPYYNSAYPGPFSSLTGANTSPLGTATPSFNSSVDTLASFVSNNKQVKGGMRVDVNQLFQLQHQQQQQLRLKQQQQQYLQDYALIQQQQQQQQASSHQELKNQSASKPKPKKIKENNKLAKGSGTNVITQKQDQDRGNNKKLFPIRFRLMNYVDDRLVDDYVRSFRSDLLTTKKSVEKLIQQYDYRKMNILYTVIQQYFEHLAERLLDPKLTHLDLIDSGQYTHDDFCSYGKRFAEFVRKFHPLNNSVNLNLMQQYECKYPKEIISLREKLLMMKLELSEPQSNSYRKNGALDFEVISQSERNLNADVDDSSSNSSNSSQNNTSFETASSSITPKTVDYKMVTYRKIDRKMLHKALSELSNAQKQLEYFISSVHMTEDSKRNMTLFIRYLNDLLLQSDLHELKPKLYEFGSLSNGLGTYDSDLDIVLKFKSINVDILDWSTSMLALEVIELILQGNLSNRTLFNTIVPSKRCPIIKLNFSNWFPRFREQMRKDAGKGRLEFNKCDLSLVSVYGVYNSKALNFLTQYDKRFHEMTLLLKFWAKHVELIDTTGFSTYAFTMLIIFFLQLQKPPVLPTFDKMRKLAAKQKNKKPLKIHKYNFEFCDDMNLYGDERGKNTKSTAELICEFFKFYHEFDFYNYVISTRLGETVPKLKMRREKIENNESFNMACYICIEDPFVHDHNVALIFRTKNIPYWDRLLDTVLSNITPTNYVLTLTDPLPIDIGKLPSKLLYPPFNFYAYDLELPEHNDRILPSQVKNIRLASIPDASDGSVWQKRLLSDVCKHMLSLYHIALKRLFDHYLSIPNRRYRIKKSTDKLDCQVDMNYIKIVQQRFNHPHLNFLINSRKRSPNDGLKKFGQLTYLHKDIINKNIYKCDLIKSAEQTELRTLFTIELRHLAATNKRTFNVTYMQAEMGKFDNGTSDYKAASIFTDVCLELLNQFNFAIDRVNPTESFDAHVKEYFIN